MVRRCVDGEKKSRDDCAVTTDCNKNRGEIVHREIIITLVMHPPLFNVQAFIVVP